MLIVKVPIFRAFELRIRGFPLMELRFKEWKDLGIGM